VPSNTLTFTGSSEFEDYIDGEAFGAANLAGDGLITTGFQSAIDGTNPNPYLDILLPSCFDHVAIYRRTSCCQNRLDHANLVISADEALTEVLYFYEFPDDTPAVTSLDIQIPNCAGLVYRAFQQAVKCIHINSYQRAKSRIFYFQCHQRMLSKNVVSHFFFVNCCMVLF
jgi:hypothetical protein